MPASRRPKVYTPHPTMTPADVHVDEVAAAQHLALDGGNLGRHRVQKPEHQLP
jgi:hypothetical protein